MPAPGPGPGPWDEPDKTFGGPGLAYTDGIHNDANQNVILNVYSQVNGSVRGPYWTRITGDAGGSGRVRFSAEYREDATDDDNVAYGQ